MNETSELVQELLESLHIADSEYRTGGLALLERGESKYLRDLKLNLKSTLTSEHLSTKECALLGIAIAVNNNNEPLTRFFNVTAEEQAASAAEIAEAAGCASLLSANNVLYRFRHFIQKERYGQIPARIRMQLMVNPVTGKEFFELMSLAVSAVNGCEMCVNAHEASVLKLGASEERVFDAVRIASLVTAAGKIFW